MRDEPPGPEKVVELATSHAVPMPKSVSRLLGLQPLDRVQAIDELMDENRQAMTILAAIRDEAVRELADATSVVQAAEVLGVTRQAVYKALQERRSLTLSGEPMSPSLTQQRIEQLQRDISRLQEKIAKETRNQVALSQRLSRARQQQAQARSSMTVQSKQRDAERLERDIVNSQRRRAELEKQVGRKTEELHRNQNKLVKEQASERDRMLRRLESASQKHEQAVVSDLNALMRHGLVKVQDVQEASIHAFISHAAEDKEEVARPLAHELTRLGLRVWYDDYELHVGDSLRRRIDDGLARSRFGIVVLSPSFFAKNWPQYELDGLVTKEMQNREKVILPLWHKVSKDEVIRYSPTLADKVALSTAQFTIADLAKKLQEAMQ